MSDQSSTISTSASILYRCDCCNTPVFAVDSGSISVVTRHHGEKHTTNISIKSLFQAYYGTAKVPS